MIWKPNESGHFRMSFHDRRPRCRIRTRSLDNTRPVDVADIVVTIGANNVTKKKTSAGFWTLAELKRPHFGLWMELEGEAGATIDLGRCRHDIDADKLHATVIWKARTWLRRRLSALPMPDN